MELKRKEPPADDLQDPMSLPAVKKQRVDPPFACFVHPVFVGQCLICSGVRAVADRDSNTCLVQTAEYELISSRMFRVMLRAAYEKEGTVEERGAYFMSAWVRKRALPPLPVPFEALRLEKLIKVIQDHDESKTYKAVTDEMVEALVDVRVHTAPGPVTAEEKRNTDFYLDLVELNGNSTKLFVHPDSSVATLKKKFERLTGIRVDRQRLVHKGTQLEDGRTLASYEAIQRGDKVQVVLRLLGS